jgi:hypothetical protein
MHVLEEMKKSLQFSLTDLQGGNLITFTCLPCRQREPGGRPPFLKEESFSHSPIHRSIAHEDGPYHAAH